MAGQPRGQVRGGGGGDGGGAAARGAGDAAAARAACAETAPAAVTLITALPRPPGHHHDPAPLAPLALPHPFLLGLGQAGGRGLRLGDPLLLLLSPSARA